MLLLTQDATLLAGQLLKVRTVDDVEALLQSITAADWVPLGDRENNFAAVHAGADAGDALLERITNGMDALIDREETVRGISGLESPRRAAEVLFGIPNGRLVSLAGERRRELAQRLSVTLRDSGEWRQPTAVVEDNGIGQHPNDFPRTVLSLNESNKVSRPEMIGAFGQGGSSTFAFAKYGIIISRRDPLLLQEGQQDEVGWTIVRFNPLNEDFRHGRYEYLVVPDGRGKFQIPRFSPEVLPSEKRNFTGLQFIAVKYQLDRYHDVAFHAKGNLWFLLNVGLYDPIYPILIRDEREKAIKEDSKRALNGSVVSGNATRLAEDKRDKIEFSNTVSIQLGSEGTAMLRYFVIAGTGDTKKDWERKANYIPKEVGVTITLNGQRQGTMRKEVFDRMGLLSIGQALVVQLDCDGLSKRAKWELFSATRDRITNSPIAARLEKEIRAAIGSDQQLRELEHERKQRVLASQSEAEAQKINKWLKDAINGIKRGTREVFRKVISTNPEYHLLGDQPLLDEVVESSVPLFPPSETQLSNPPAQPTTLHVLNPIVKVPVGGTGVVRLAIDAEDDFVSPEPGGGRGQFTAKFTKGSELFGLTGYSAMRRGVIRATIAAEKGVPAGESGRVIFVVTRPEGMPLLAEADVITVEPPQARAKPAGSKQGPEQGPNVMWANRDLWLGTLGQSDDVVAKIQEDPAMQTTTIYVYSEYPKLMDRLARERVPQENIVHYQSKYVAAMALAAWLQHDQQKEGDLEVSQEAKDAELRRAAELFLFAEYVARDTMRE